MYYQGRIVCLRWMLCSSAIRKSFRFGMNWAIFTGCPDDYKAKDVPDKGNIRSKNGENKGEVVSCSSFHRFSSDCYSGHSH